MTNYIQDDISIQQKSNLTSEVSQIGEMHLEGNITPHTWYQHIKFENGKADLISITLLSEIVYWYRPTYVKDEHTGKLIAVKKKFKSDALQKSKKNLADQFGLTERQIQESLARLESLGLITREFRTIDTEMGKCGNVMYIQIHPVRIKEISFPERHTYNVQTSEGSHPNVIPITFKRQTNTEITTKTTHREREAGASPPPPPSSNKKPKEEEVEEKKTYFGNIELTQKQYDTLLQNYGNEKLKWMLAFLSAKIGANHGYDKRYKSHYHVLLPSNWVHKAYEEEMESKSKTSAHKTYRDNVMDRFKHGKLYNGAECFLDENGIGFQRGMTHKSVRFKDHGFEEQLNNILRFFNIKE